MRTWAQLARSAALPAALAVLLGGAENAHAQDAKKSPRGDANLSGSVSAIDAQAVLSAVVNLPLPDDFHLLPWGDANCSNTIQALDAQLILSHVVGIPTGDACVGEILARVMRVDVTPNDPGLVPGSNLPLTIAAFDSADAPLVGRQARYRMADTAIATVSNAGVLSGLAIGSTSLAVRVEGVLASHTVDVAAAMPIGSLSTVIGDSIVYFAGGFWSPVIAVKDQAGRPLPNAAVTIAVASGGGTLWSGNTQVQSITLTSDASGWVFPEWSFGPDIETANQITASATGAPTITLNAFTVPVIEGRHMCEIASTGALYCWGRNVAGQLGDGSQVDRMTPALVAGGISWKSLPRWIRSDFTCAIAVDDVLYCWGANEYGQLGDGTTTNRATPTAIGGALRFSAVSLGHHHACAITTDGEAYCWGANWMGNLGDGTSDNRLTPTPVAAPLQFKDVASGGWHTCALEDNGADAGPIYCWGTNNEGQLGDGTMAPSRIPVLTGGGMWFTGVGVGERHSCGIGAAGGRALCWGANFGSGQLGDGTTHWRALPTAVSGGPAFTEIAGEALTTCARTAGGEVWCWGSNSIGQVGDGTLFNRHVPVRSGSGLLAASMRMGRSTTCARAVSGIPFCWGNNAFGALGDGTTINRATPGAVLWVEGTAGQAATLTMVANTNAQSGVINGSVPLAPSVVARDFTGAPVAGVTVTFVPALGGGSVTGNVVVTGADGVATVGTWTLGSTIGAVNTLTASAAGVPDLVFRATASVVPASLEASAGDGQAQPINFGTFNVPAQVLVKDGGGVPAPFVNVTFTVTSGSGQVNGASSVSRATNGSGLAAVTWTMGSEPGVHTVTATVDGLSPITFTATSTDPLVRAHACEITAAGAAYCWGDNSRGQLGDGTTTGRVSPALVSGGHTFSSLAAGMTGDFSCGLTAGGAAFCWGANDLGQLGDGTTSQRNQPVPVAGGLVFSRLAAGAMHACGITTDGLLYCWGNNVAGQIGDGTHGNNRLTPTLVEGLGALAVAANDLHTCAVASGGNTYCWGEGSSGQLGHGSTSDRFPPHPVSGGHSFATITAGARHTCALTAAGTAYCWGANENGELGNGAPGVIAALPNSNVPVEVGQGLRLPRPENTDPVPESIAFAALSAGVSHTCGVSTSGEVWCWGADASGQTGKGTITPARYAPDRPTAGRYETPRAGAAHTCAPLQGSRMPHCWGANFAGQLGTGATSNPLSAPTAVTSWPEGTPGVAARVEIIAGLGQSAQVGSSLGIPPSVRVRDHAGNAVVGETVTFVVTTRGPGCTETSCANFVGSASPVSAVTNAAGIATTEWTLGESTASGFNFMDAVVAGPVPPATFSARNVAAPASIVGNLSATGLANLVAPEGFSPIVSPNVFVSDAANAALPNVEVTFAPASGSGTVVNPVRLTGTGGTAFTEWVFGPPGSMQLSVSVAGLPPVVFTGTSVPRAAGSHTCTIRDADAALYCWGSNRYGQLGNNSTTHSTTPISALTGYTQVTSSMRGDFTCAITSASQLHCWGANALRQLQNNNTTDRLTPTPVTNSGAIPVSQVAVGEYNVCVIEGTGKAYCGGWPEFGVSALNNQLFLNNNLVANGMVNYTQVAVGEQHACALTSGVIHCWGTNAFGQLGNGAFEFVNRTTPAVIANATYSAVVAGAHHTCGVSTGGDVYCWGRNDAGQLGIGTMGGSFSTPQLVTGGIPFNPAMPRSIAASANATCALRQSDSTAFCWGSGSFGQLGDGTGNTSASPVAVASSVAFREIMMGLQHACGIAAATGVPFCWGSNSFGQLGDGTTEARLAPVSALWPDAGVGSPANLVIQSGDGQSAAIGANLPAPIGVRVTSLDGSAVAGVPVTFSVDGGSTDLVNGIASATINTDGRGIAEATWTLDNTTGPHAVFANVDGLPGVTFSATALATPAATIAVISGDNQTAPLQHVLGVPLTVEVRDAGSAVLQGVPVRFRAVQADGQVVQVNAVTDANGLATVEGAFSASVAGPASISAEVGGLAPVTFTATAKRNARSVHACDVSRDLAQAFCWGMGEAGQLGNGSTNQSTTPAQVAGGIAFQSVATGMSGDFSCGLTAAGAAWCWGNNDFGQLGDGTTVSTVTPVAVANGITFTSLSLGRFHSCGLSSAGTVYCWGWNGYGQLGAADQTDRTTPAAVAGGATYTSLASGWYHSCAVRSDAAVDCWGHNGSGQVGNGIQQLASNTPSPVVGGLTFTSVTAGQGHSCGIATDGATHCWGGNWLGQLGTGNTSPVLTPGSTPVVGGALFQSIAAGNDWTCGILTDSLRVMCWGGNWAGQLGDGTFQDRFVPTLVAGGFAASELRPGTDFTCARSNDIPYCWGNAWTGQLGDGQFGAARPVPAPTQWLYLNGIAPGADGAAAATPLPRPPGPGVRLPEVPGR